MEEINEEKDLKKSIIPISIEQTEKIVTQMKKCVCKIYKEGNGTGFFCKFPLLNSQKYVYVLLTNYHVLGKNDIKDNSTVSFSIGEEAKINNIVINSKRKKYTNEELDITIIEINPKKDNISKNDFLELDENINQDEESLKNIYGKKSIYLLGYPDSKEVKVSYGIIDFLNLETKRINHLCYTKGGSSGSPILLLENCKIIGVHFGSPGNGFEFNYGTFIKYPYLDFLNNNEFKDEEEDEKEKEKVKEKENSSINNSFDKKNDEKYEYIYIKKHENYKNEKHGIYHFKFYEDKEYLEFFNNKAEIWIKNKKEEKYAEILFEIYYKFRKNAKKLYSIEFALYSSLCEWKIFYIGCTKKLIVKFKLSDNPEYDLILISYLMGYGEHEHNLKDLNFGLGKDKYKIDLEEDSIDNLYKKISLFFGDFFTLGNITRMNSTCYIL